MSPHQRFWSTISLLICGDTALSVGLVRTPGVLADNNHEIKRGDHPYMAFIYFLDPTIVDLTGARFIRSAFLIRPDWLVTSALGPRVIDTPNGFPKQTLMARVGAISIDANITLIEEEFEQEREVVQVVRPFNHSATQWWTTDISLLKTLLPFNLTSTVGVKAINAKRTFEEKICFILFYSQMSNNTDKSLMQMFVEMLPLSITNCGTHFLENTMVCASDSEVNKGAVYDPNFCQGNSGGPLICENEIMGVQTYIENDCRQPHLYQQLSGWDNFITCSVEVKCHEEQCANICDVTYKDPPLIVSTTVAKKPAPEVNVSKSEEGEPAVTSSSASPAPTMTPELIVTNETTIPDTTTTVSKTVDIETTPTTTSTTTEAPTTPPPETTTEDAEKVWPKEKPRKLKNADIEADNADIRVQEKVMAQLQKKQQRAHGSSQKIKNVILTILLLVVILACLN